MISIMFLIMVWVWYFQAFRYITWLAQFHIECEERKKEEHDAWRLLNIRLGNFK